MKGGRWRNGTDASLVASLWNDRNLRWVFFVREKYSLLSCFFCWRREDERKCSKKKTNKMIIWIRSTNRKTNRREECWSTKTAMDCWCLSKVPRNKRPKTLLLYHHMRKLEEMMNRSREREEQKEQTGQIWWSDHLVMLVPSGGFIRAFYGWKLVKPVRGAQAGHMISRSLIARWTHRKTKEYLGYHEKHPTKNDWSKREKLWENVFKRKKSCFFEIIG